jgi:hypothetical protein
MDHIKDVTYCVLLDCVWLDNGKGTLCLHAVSISFLN